MDSAPLLQVSVHKTETLLFFTLLQLSVIILSARLAGNLAVRWGNSRAGGEILVGILLGPSLFGLLWAAGFEVVFRSSPAEPLTILSQIGAGCRVGAGPGGVGPRADPTLLSPAKAGEEHFRVVGIPKKS